jgi:hypothetical protein
MILKTNEYWGRRSGMRNYRGVECAKDGARPSNAFKAVQFDTGSSGNRHPIRTSLKNIPKKWFNKTYRSKRG